MRTYALPIYLQRFFTERLASQLHASPNTIASYRDTFRLLLRYAADRLRQQPTQLQVVDLGASLVGDFLTFLETKRGNGARSRNTRLSAIHPFFKYVAGNEPQLLHHRQQILAMPSIDQATSCLPSWKGSGYADFSRSCPVSHAGPHKERGIIRRSA
jgi:integrase/recombinase XerD